MSAHEQLRRVVTHDIATVESHHHDPRRRLEVMRSMALLISLEVSLDEPHIGELAHLSHELNERVTAHSYMLGVERRT